MLSWASFALLLLAGAVSAAAPIEFNRDIRPILSDKCWHCHGPDALTKKIPLRLDREAEAKKDLGGRRAVVEGDAAASEVVKRIEAPEKSGRRMPPAYSGLKLTPAESETLKQWIAQGAKWEGHWSFVPPKRHAAPQVSNPAWVRNPIDSFVLARLDREGLKPSPEASRETLLRRVTLDLTGLPPTVAEIDAFLADGSANAYEKAVDRLLASPRYGERMAARWLDAARYADTNGYQFDGPRDMWRWRDWVIASFNRNQPYDQFVREQLAGDLLPNATRDQIVATGFNRNHRANTEDGIIPEEYAVEYVADRVETMSTVFLGLTLGCSRCHNHKYDPFTQKEFYQLFAYFNNVPELGRAMKYGNSPPTIPAPTPDQDAALAALDRKIAAARGVLEAQAGALTAAQRAWEKTLDASRRWEPTTGIETALDLEGDGIGKAVDGAASWAEGVSGRALRLDGKTFLDAGGTGIFDIEDRFSMGVWVNAEGTPDGAVVSRMADNPKGRGYGIHLDRGKVHVHLTSVWADDALRVETEDAIPAGRWVHLLFTYTGSRMSDGLRVYVDGKLAKVKVQQDTLYRPFRNAGNAFREPLRIGGGWGPERRFKGRVDSVRLWKRVLAEDEVAAMALPETLARVAAKPSRTAAESFALRSAFLESGAGPEVRETWARLTAMNFERERMVRSFPTVMVMAERPRRRDTFLLLRGAYDKPGDKVEPGVPAALPSLPADAPANRLALAQWLTGPNHPLTARVAVNRFWQMYFGVGLVKTTEDFGAQGEWPSHPDLLDWLATEFTRTGWDVKALQKTIVLSATYRQSSKAAPEVVARDPENRLLARGPRFRLPAEMLRDQALAASGLLKERLGGPSVKPYQPAGLWKELIMQDMDYVQSTGDDLHRRSLYTFWKRTIAPPMMANFDAANREACVVRETRTNTPLQALNLMNDVTFLEAARWLGQRMMKEAGSDPAARLRLGFRLATGRAPSAPESEVLRGSLNYHLDYFAEPKRAQAYLKQGEAGYDAALDPRELAAYASVASLIFNLDEAVTRE